MAEKKNKNKKLLESMGLKKEIDVEVLCANDSRVIVKYERSQFDKFLKACRFFNFI